MKKIRVEVFKEGCDFFMTVYVNDHYYTQEKSKNLKELLINAHDYLIAEVN